MGINLIMREFYFILNILEREYISVTEDSFDFWADNLLSEKSSVNEFFSWVADVTIEEYAERRKRETCFTILRCSGRRELRARTKWKIKNGLLHGVEVQGNCLDLALVQQNTYFINKGVFFRFYSSQMTDIREVLDDLIIFLGGGSVDIEKDLFVLVDVFSFNGFYFQNLVKKVIGNSKYVEEVIFFDNVFFLAGNLFFKLDFFLDFTESIGGIL